MLDLFGRPTLVDTGDRNEFDYYPTPAWMTDTLLHWYPEIRGATVLEPCVGDGAIARVLEQAGCTVITNDIDPRWEADYHLDATGPDLWATLLEARVQYVVSNFPFGVAMGVLRYAVPFASTAVILRKTFLEPTEERGEWLMASPPSGFIGLPRHNFRGDGNDSVSCDWMLWGFGAPVAQRSTILIDPFAKQRHRQ